MKQASIETEKVMVGETPFRRILGFKDVLSKDELPAEYLQGELCFFKDSEYIHVNTPDSGWSIQPGEVLKEQTFQEVLVWLKRAGSRLAKIRKKEQESWGGKEVVTI